jgi:hypothetical protein
MRQEKILKVVLIVLAVVVGLWALELVLHIGLGMINVVFSLIGGIFGLLFSGEVIVLAGLALVAYLIWSRRDRRRARHGYDY